MSHPSSSCNCVLCLSDGQRRQLPTVVVISVEISPISPTLLDWSQPVQCPVPEYKRPPGPLSPARPEFLDSDFYMCQ